MDGTRRAGVGLLITIVLSSQVAARTDEAGRIAGRVEDQCGAGVARADVRLTRLDPELGALSYSTTRGALSDERGAFEFTAVPAGAWLLEARDGERWQPIPLRVLVGDAAPREIVLHLEPAGCVIGEVTDKDGRPIAGVGVAVGDGGLQGKDVEPVTMLDLATGELIRMKRGLRYPRLPLAVTHTDSQGRFRLAPVLPDRPIPLRVGGLPPFHDRTVECAANGGGEPTVVSVMLDRAAAVIGRVVGEESAPLPHARVTLRALERHPTKAGWIVLPREPRAGDAVPSTVLLADDDGLFRFDGLYPGHYLVIADADGRASGTSALLAIRQSDEVLETEVTLAPGAALAGTVTDADGTPSEGAVVRVLADSSVSPDLFPFLDPIEVRADEKGAFRIPGLALEASVVLSIESADGARCSRTGVVRGGAERERAIAVRLPRVAGAAAIIAAATNAERARRSQRAATPPARSTRP